jgi:hypothetical protein
MDINNLHWYRNKTHVFSSFSVLKMSKLFIFLHKMTDRWTVYGPQMSKVITLDNLPDALLNGMSKADSNSPAISWNLNQKLQQMTLIFSSGQKTKLKHDCLFYFKTCSELVIYWILLLVVKHAVKMGVNVCRTYFRE